MNHLVRHTLEPGSHDHLAFHPACANCRNARLAGRVSNQPLVPRRMRAGVAAAVIGASALASSVKAAAPAQAQQPTDTETGQGAPMVSPEELDKQLADPGKADRKRPSRTAQGPDGSVLVRPGDSLWTIAHDELGGARSNARIAKEVDRLWSLNAARIGTGNPDLIRPGQRLRLR